MVDSFNRNNRKTVLIYFEPDNLMSTKINGTIEEITKYYSIGDMMRLGYSEEYEDGKPYRIKGLEIFDEEKGMVYIFGDCISKYKCK